MPKLEAYDKSLDYAYALGLFPANECLTHAGDRALRLLLSEKAVDSTGAQALQAKAQALGIRTELADRALERLSRKENCHAAVVYRKAEGSFDGGSHIVLHQPSDAGNMGTILRTALGFGYRNVAIIRPAVDSDDPKVVRASMGAVFSLNIRHFDTFDAYRAAYPSLALYPFMLTGAVPLAEAAGHAPARHALIFGNEATGLPEHFAALGVSTLIPHSAAIDSLNLAIAAGIGMYTFSHGADRA